MKTKLPYVLLFSVLFYNHLNAQNTYVPDDAFEQHLINIGRDTAPLDDYVLTANIETIGYLDINNLNISDLTGLEDFTALTTLYASSNPLNSIDVSSNIALTTLYVSITNITSIDVSNNTALTSLAVGYNPITTLDISNNTALKFLSINNTALSSLDLSIHTSLISFNASGTPISNFDLSNNTDLIYLSFSENSSLTNLDISANTLLKYLYVDNTSLNGLDLSNNTVLTDFLSHNTDNLDCITVADATSANASTGIYTTWVKDATCSYSEDCDALNIVDFETSNVYVGPNPVKEELSIILNNVAVLKDVRLFDITGKLILKSTNTRISTEHIKSGLYLVKITTDKGSFTRKLVKK